MNKEILKYKPKDETFKKRKLTKKEKEEQFYKAIKENGQFDKIIIKSDFVNFSTKVLCQCKKHINYEWWVTPNNLMNNHGCNLCGNESIKQKKRMTQEEFLKRFNETGRVKEIEILGEFKGFNLGKEGEIKCWCKKGQHEFYMNPTTLLNGNGCFQCSYEERAKKKLQQGLDSLNKYIKDNDLHIKLEDEYKGAGVKLHFRCLDCGNDWLVDPDHIKQGRRCPFCNDGISFNNKVLRIIFDILKPDNYDVEYGKPWNFEYFYDGYFTVTKSDGSIQEILVEMDGEPHKKECACFKSRTLADNQRIDAEKDRLAKEGGYILIRINCSKSTHKQTVEEIKKSKLGKYLDFSKLNWDEVVKRAQKSLAIEVCEFVKDNSNMKKKDICEKFHISETALNAYVQTGRNFGLLPENFCFTAKATYNPNTKHVYTGKAICMFDDSDHSVPIYIFLSSNDCSRYFKVNYNEFIDRHEISKVLSGKRPSYKGHFFTYATQEDMIKYKDLITIIDRSINVH